MAKVKPKRSEKKPKRKAREIVKRKPSSGSWIEAMTGQDAKWWVAEVQGLITKHSRPTKNPWHGTTKTSMAMAELITLVQKHGMPKKGPAYDGNMRMASILSFILATWYLRLHRAKSYDPRRPVRHRQAAYWSRLGYATALFMAIMAPINREGCNRCFKDWLWFEKVKGYHWEGEWVKGGEMKAMSYYTCLTCHKIYCVECWVRKPCDDFR